jgi:hypothetical protein
LYPATRASALIVENHCEEKKRGMIFVLIALARKKIEG